jgi:CPA2 family monovalent cation:H+ antiporter-2
VESESSLLLDVAVAFGVALAGGWLATRLRLPAIVGYIAAGLLISPFTPGFVGDVGRLRLLSDVGIVLLLFAVGVHFTIADIARGGVRIVLITLLSTGAVLAAGLLLAPALGWSWEEGAYAGAAAAICSSVVIVTLLERRGEISSEHGRIAISFSVMQDLLAVILIVVLEAITGEGEQGTSEVLRDAGLAALKAAAFIAGVLLIGIRVVPFVLNRVAEERSRELFFLAVAALIIGTALASEYVGLSLALGAFLAGIVVSESDLSHRVIGELLPVRDVFAVLFFVTAGMLVDPEAIVEEWPAMLAALGLIIVVKPLLVTGMMLIAKYQPPVSLLVGALMVPSAEFTFLLVGSGLDGGILSDDLFSAIIAAAVISIVLGPFALAGAEWLGTRQREAVAGQPAAAPAPASRLGRRAIICGYNHIGETVAAILGPRFDVRVIEEDPRRAREARSRDLDVVEGSPISPAVISHAGIEDARVIVIALADPFATRLFAERARAINPHVDVVTQAVLSGEVIKLRESGVSEAVIADDEVAFELARYGLHRFGLSSRESLAIIQQWRARLRLAD